MNTSNKLCINCMYRKISTDIYPCNKCLNIDYNNNSKELLWKEGKYESHAELINRVINEHKDCIELINTLDNISKETLNKLANSTRNVLSAIVQRLEN